MCISEYISTHILYKYLISRYSPCDDTPTAATAMDRKVEYGNKKNIFLQIRSDTPPAVTATVAEVGVSSQGLYVATYQISELIIE